MSKRHFLFLLAFLLGSASFGSGQDLVGPLTREQILSGCPGWDAVAASYIPSPEAVARLREFNRPVQIEVYLGSWCSDSKAHVPAFLTVLDAVDSPLFSATFIGVPENKEARGEFTAGKNIQKIPTFIISVEGQEKGRIIETPVKSVEQDLVEILTR